MIPVKQAAAEFLAQKRIAVTGVSRSPKDHGANVVYKRLRDRGYTVFAINPNADEVEGDHCYHDLTSVPGGVEGVVIGTSPAQRRGDHARGGRPAHRPRVDAPRPRRRQRLRGGHPLRPRARRRP